MASGIVESSSSQGSSSQQPQNPGAGRSKLVQRLLAASGNLPQFVNDLLSTMAVVVAGTEAAGFLIERQQIPADTASGSAGDDGTGGGEAVSAPGGDGDDAVVQGAPQISMGGNTGLALRAIAHLRPDDSDAETRAAALKAFQEIVLPCVQQNKDGAIEVGAPDAGEPQFCLVTLLRNEGVVVAAAAVITRSRDLERARQRLTSMQLVAGYFELFSLRRHADQARAIATSHQNVLQLATSVGTAEGFESAAMNLCNELSTRTGASRVSIGWIKGRNIKMRALSHTEKFDKKQELIVQIEKAMEECVDQEEPVRYEFDGQRSENVTRSAQELSRLQGGNSVLSLPLRRKDEVLGVLTLEFAPPAKLPAATVEALAVAADLLTPQLKDRFDNDRWLATKAGHSLQYVTGLAIGPKHMLAKLVISIVIGLLLFICLFKTTYHVSAPFQFAALGKQQVSIPFEGRLDHISNNPRTGKPWQSGDEVHKNDALAVMNLDELRQQRYKARGDYAKAAAEADAATNGFSDASNGKAAGELRMAQADMESAAASIRLYEKQIEQATMYAAFDGVIVRFDDPDSKRDLAVKRGDVLMEIAKLGEYRGELAVSDRDIQEIIENGKQTLTLMSSSFPDSDHEIKAHIDRIATPGEAKEGDSVFKVLATIDPGQKQQWIRPGISGEAHVDIGKRRLVWIWTHRLVDFVRLKLWM
jgi:hypothetical protein